MYVCLLFKKKSLCKDKRIFIINIYNFFTSKKITSKTTIITFSREKKKFYNENDGSYACCEIYRKHFHTSMYDMAGEKRQTDDILENA